MTQCSAGRAEVAILVTPVDELAAQTLFRAFEREGWKSTNGAEPASCAIVVWSPAGINDGHLGERARSYLDAGRLLQVLWQPQEWRYNKTGEIEPPEPFRYYEGLELPFDSLDGSDLAVDWFDFKPGEGQRILGELARLGRLPRPRDHWNAEIEFEKPLGVFRRLKKVYLAEFNGDGRLLRRRELGGDESAFEIYRTTMGNCWIVADGSTGEKLRSIAVEKTYTHVHLDEIARRWSRIFAYPGGHLDHRDDDSPQPSPAGKPVEGPSTGVVDIFVSYAHEESDIAHRLKHLFDCEDWSCWWDKPNIGLGQDFRPLVAQRIDAAKVVAVLWSEASQRSTWVRWEVERARAAGKLIEFIVTPSSGPIDRHGSREVLAIGRYPHIPPLRDQVLRHLAQGGKLARRSDLWDSRIVVANWNHRPPRRPIIAWEFVFPGTGERRIVRRERWVDGEAVTFGTRIGNAWLFGEENHTTPIGYCFVKTAEHEIELPKPSRSRDDSFVIPFNVDVRLPEFMPGGFRYPDGGVDLGAR